jgi:phage gp16-like protein
MTAARASANRAPGRNRDLAMIHIAKQQLGMNDDTYRDMLWSIGRVRSAKDLDMPGRYAVLAHLRACGWKDVRRRPSPYKKGSQAALIRHLWTQLARAGVVQDESDRALRAFVKAQTAPHNPNGQGWDDPRLLPREVASLVIEHLKQWQARTAR